jgi:cellulose biosynthesis protein BcsQ
VPKPYILAICSHKGGTSRTTSALTLAWVLGQSGRRVLLVDADEQRSASLLALDARGQFCWPNVEFRAGAEALDEKPAVDVVVVDPPALTAATAQPILRQAHGIILTCLADPLSIRTVPAAATVIENAKNANRRLELLGILIGIYHEHDAVQNAMLTRLQEAHRDLMLDPPIPFQVEVRRWAMRPGSPPPQGPALDAYSALIRNLDSIIGNKPSVVGGR